MNIDIPHCITLIRDGGGVGTCIEVTEKGKVTAYVMVVTPELGDKAAKFIGLLDMQHKRPKDQSDEDYVLEQYPFAHVGPYKAMVQIKSGETTEENANPTIGHADTVEEAWAHAALVIMEEHVADELVRSGVE